MRMKILLRDPMYIKHDVVNYMKKKIQMRWKSEVDAFEKTLSMTELKNKMQHHLHSYSQIIFAFYHPRETHTSFAKGSLMFLCMILLLTPKWTSSANNWLQLYSYLFHLTQVDPKKCLKCLGSAWVKWTLSITSSNSEGLVERRVCLIHCLSSVSTFLTQKTTASIERNLVSSWILAALIPAQISLISGECTTGREFRFTSFIKKLGRLRLPEAARGPKWRGHETFYFWTSSNRYFYLSL